MLPIGNMLASITRLSPLDPNVVVTSDSETSTEEQKNSEPESSDDKTSDVWCKTDQKPDIEPFICFIRS
jgi:hypothetical protein